MEVESGNPLPGKQPELNHGESPTPTTSSVQSLSTGAYMGISDTYSEGIDREGRP